MLRVNYQELVDVFFRVLVKNGLEDERARKCARLFAETDRDGVYTHGLSRFPRFISAIKSGVVDVHGKAEMVTGFGAVERWDGRIGPGNLNAQLCMTRAIELSRINGVGCVALANTNHWMRGGSYGWQAADAGVIGICWTNTMPNLPPWGATDPRVGNNPLVIAVPRAAGHVVLDMAMSQFSYGTLAAYRMRNEQLPVEGGFDSEGKLTRDPASIEKSARPLPIGFWKGSGLALMLDLLGAVLSGGQATYQIPMDADKETRLTQVFVAFDPVRLDQKGAASQAADNIIQYFQLPPKSTGARVRYPGERVLKTRDENLAKGVPVEPSVWKQVQAM